MLGWPFGEPVNNGGRVSPFWTEPAAATAETGPARNWLDLGTLPGLGGRGDKLERADMGAVEPCGDERVVSTGRGDLDTTEAMGLDGPV